MDWSRFIPKSEVLDILWSVALGMCMAPLIPANTVQIILGISIALVIFNHTYVKRREERLRRKNTTTECLGNFKWCAETLVREGALIGTLKELVDEAAVRATMTE